LDARWSKIKKIKATALPVDIPVAAQTYYPSGNSSAVVKARQQTVPTDLRALAGLLRSLFNELSLAFPMGKTEYRAV